MTALICACGHDEHSHYAGGCGECDQRKAQGRIVPCPGFVVMAPRANTYALDDKARRQVRAMLRLVAVEVRPCKRCGRELFMLKMNNSGNLNPFTDDAVSHFADCPDAASFRRSR
jgi:hypothetical protein